MQRARRFYPRKQLSAQDNKLLPLGTLIDLQDLADGDQMITLLRESRKAEAAQQVAETKIHENVKAMTAKGRFFVIAPKLLKTAELQEIAVRAEWPNSSRAHQDRVELLAHVAALDALRRDVLAQLEVLDAMFPWCLKLIAVEEKLRTGLVEELEVERIVSRR